jgi:hypothetical protein
MKPGFSVSAAEFDFSNMDLANVHDPTPDEIGHLNASLFQNKYRELFATLDMAEVGGRLYSWVRVNAPMDSPLSIKDQLAWSELAVLELIERGVIKQIVQTPEADADLQKLQAAVSEAGLRPAPARVAQAIPERGVPSEAELDDLAVQEWRLSPVADVKKHMRQDSAFKSRVESLMAAGRI